MSGMQGVGRSPAPNPVVAPKSQNGNWKKEVDSMVSNFGVETDEDKIFAGSLALLQIAAKSPEQAKYVTDKASRFLSDYKVPERLNTEQKALCESRYGAAMNILANIHDGKLPGPDHNSRNDTWLSDMYLKPKARKGKAPQEKTFDYSGKNSAVRESMNNAIVNSFKALAEKAPLASISSQAHNQLHDWKISGYEDIVD
ncbi:MAG: hypothetical protein WC527_06190 [Candidatus Margulisiibacteriota bacterium]